VSPSLSSSCIRSRLTRQLLERLKFAILILRIYLPDGQILRSWGWGTLFMQDSFLFSFLSEQMFFEG
jgi:hypothetical protein